MFTVGADIIRPRVSCPFVGGRLIAAPTIDYVGAYQGRTGTIDYVQICFVIPFSAYADGTTESSCPTVEEPHPFVGADGTFASAAGGGRSEQKGVAAVEI